MNQELKMYNVFLVDDEPILLEGIRSKIDWESIGLNFVGEATDGEIALSMLQELKPDILITDVKMPFMDGLELSSRIKKIQPWIKIIILSGHDEFEYAKKAISIGVEDYILKPFTADEVIESLKKACVQIDKERAQLSDISKMKEELKSQNKLMQKDFLNNLVHGELDFNSVFEKSTNLGIDLQSNFYRILISKIENNNEDSQELQHACSLINSYSSAWSHALSFFHHNNLLVCILKGKDKSELEENTFHIAETIEHIVSKNHNCKVISAIGRTVENIKEISNSYADAKKIQEIAKSEKSVIISSDDIDINNTDLLNLKENNPLVERLKYAGKSEIPSLIEESLALIRNNPGQFQVFASYLLVDLIFAVSKLVENFGGDLKKENPEMIQRSFIDNAVASEEIFVSKMQTILNFALDYRDSKLTSRYGTIILKAKDYIEKKYSDQNTTLTSVAEFVCLSPNHFSTIFSQECNITFIEYLTNVRIEHAKQLIKNTEMKGYDIAYECGFSDPHYFSYIFKKNTGLTPREYKSSITTSETGTSN